MVQVGQLFSTKSTCLFSDTPQGGASLTWASLGSFGCGQDRFLRAP